jgi:ribosome assembly protein 1
LITGIEMNKNEYNLFSGQVNTAVKEACRAAVFQNNPRLVGGILFL